MAVRPRESVTLIDTTIVPDWPRGLVVTDEPVYVVPSTVVE